MKILVKGVKEGTIGIPGLKPVKVTGGMAEVPDEMYESLKNDKNIEFIVTYYEATQRIGKVAGYVVSVETISMKPLGDSVPAPKAVAPAPAKKK